VAGLTLSQQALRTARQAVLLQPIAPGLGARRHLTVFFVGFLAIATFPARLGEFVRPALLQRSRGTPVAEGLAFVAAERALDMLAVLFGLAWALGSADIGRRAGSVAHDARPLLLAAAPALAVAFLAAIFRGEVLLARLPRPAGGVRARVHGALERFVGALSRLRSPRRLAVASALTVLHFACMVASAWWIAQALGLGGTLGPLACLGVLGLTMVGLALPAPPGQVGVFEGSAVAATWVFGVTRDQAPGALAFALLLHGWPLAVHALATAPILARDPALWRELTRDARREADARSARA